MTTCSHVSKPRVVSGVMWPSLCQDINLVPKSRQIAKRVGRKSYPCLQNMMLEFRAERNTGVQRIFGCDGRWCQSWAGNASSSARLMLHRAVDR